MKQLDENSRIGKQIPAEIRRATRSVGYAIWLNDTAGWTGLTPVLRARLTEHQRVGLAFAVLRSLPDHIAHKVAAERLPDNGAGYPLVTLDGAMTDARWWASLASQAEIKAYAVAAFQAMPGRDQSAFLDWAQGGRIAA